MVKLREKPFLTPNEKGITGKHDAASIQKAIDSAAKNGVNKVVIPRYNTRTDSGVWVISKTLRIPANMMLVLDNCHLELAEGFKGPMFANSLYDNEDGKLIAGEQTNIRIQGKGDVVLSGQGRILNLHNVRNFTVEGFRVAGSAGNAIMLMYCTYGKVFNIDFAGDCTAENQNGITLRSGCHDVTVENITGVVGSNMIALVAEAGPELDVPAHVMGMVMDIRNIIIKNIKATCNGNLVKLFNQDGRMLYNILIESVSDTSADYSENRPFSAVMVGDTEAKPNVRAALPGETKTVTVRNVFTRGHYGVAICGALTNTLLESIHIHGDGEYAVATIGEETTKLANLLCKGIYYTVEQRKGEETLAAADYTGAVLAFENCEGEPISVQDIFVSKATCFVKASGEVTIDMNCAKADALGVAPVCADDHAKVNAKNVTVKEEQK